MSIKISELIDSARDDVALAYARVEIDHNRYRRAYKTRSRAWRYFLDTEIKRNLSSVLFEANVTKTPIKIQEMSHRLLVSRQQISRTIKEAVAEKWVVSGADGYWLSNKLSAEYVASVPTMLLSMEHQLTEKMQKLINLIEIREQHETLTNNESSPMLNVRSVING